ncbi:hypothetical protein IP364_04595 [Helicobacter winghamensis]|uniref:DUF6094 domain-containing protein n=1 Tax=Helicobacter winghamensis TaxID=157268 RepID=UPI00279EE376
MARLACEEKLAYYPTDPNAVIAFFEAMKANGEFGDFRVCDPCCGMGDILSLFKTHFKGVQTYGVELDVERAEIASDKVDILINNDALFGIQKTKSAFKFLFLNPPYGDIKLEKNERLETEFIKKWLGTLEINGLLLLIINPSSATPLMAKLLENGGMEFKASFYFENKDRELYKQYFMLFQKTKEPTNNLLEHIHPDNAIPFSETDLSEIFIPKSKKEKITFKAFGDLKDWQKEKMLSKSSLSKDFIHSLLTPAISIGVSSIQIPNEGQSALLLGAGACDREVNGYLIKGSFEKVEVQGEATENGQRVQENFVSNIYAFDTYKGSYFKLI